MVIDQKNVMSHSKKSTLSLKQKLIVYSRPDWRRSLWQITNSLIPYLVLVTLMYFSLDFSYWLTLALAIPAGGFMIRTFIIFHDCGHGSFLKSRKWSSIIGFTTGILTFTPYHQWRYNHAQHHATCGDLDRRGVGDVWTLTVDEYKKLSKWQRLGYRLYRNPLIMFGIGPLYMFLISNRFSAPGAKRRERYSIYWTNAVLLLLIIVVSLLIGFKSYVLIQLPILLIALPAGVWLFYVQHQFEDVYWHRHEGWDFERAALEGSSFYKLPAVLQWFTGNIGFHHVHHLNARIPNYYLPACHKKIDEFQKVKPITILKSLKSLKFRLFDEKSARLVGFKFIETPVL